MKIADGLSVPVSTLLAGPGPRFAPGCRAVPRAGTGTRLETAHGSYRLLEDEIASQEMATALLRVTSRPTALGGYPGAEFFLLVCGSVEFPMPFYATLVVESGSIVVLYSDT